MKTSVYFLGAFCAALVIFVPRGFGQTYHLPFTPYSNSNGYIDTSGTNIDLKAPTWTSANGYGVWTTNSLQWYLLGNELHDEHASVPVSPSGVVAEGSLGYLPTWGEHDVKVVSNLHGKVRYIWPDESTGSPRDRFVVKGFDSTDIHINFTGIPKTANSTKVISGTINTYASLLTGAGRNVCSPITEAGEWIDCYDAAMDTKYLYVVWERFYMINSVKFYEIWAAAQNLVTHAVDFGPTRVDGGDTTTYDFDYAGRRPTVACDVRSAPSTPTFDVAFINYIPEPDSMGSGSIVHSWIHNGVVEMYTQNRKVLKHVTDPLVSDDYLTPLHVRMLTSSVPGMTTPVKAIYAIVYSPGSIGQANGALIEHRIVHNTIPEQPYAYYVDGADAPPLITNADHEAPLHSVSGSSDVINKPIMGVANPYDGAADSTYDEFHCTYALNVIDTSAHLPVAPLLMVRGYHNSIFGGGNPNILNRTCTNCDVVPVPDSALRVWGWFGNGSSLPPKTSVNQMGIHNLWVTKIPTVDGLAYSRDLRDFDEDIEENTLVTDSCVISDGRWHGGTLGAHMLPGRTMSLWTDPNFGVTSTSSGIYLAPTGSPAGWHNARIALVGDSVSLNIAGTRLVALPNFEFRFTGASQELNIDSGAIFEYYGLPRGTTNDGTGPLATCFIGTGAINLVGGWINPGSGYWDAPMSWHNPAVLNIHGGANFKLPESVTITSTNSIINFLRENSIVPITYISSITQDNGIANFHGKTTFTSSKLLTHLPADSVTNLLFFNNCLTSGCTPAFIQLNATKCLFQNDATGGFAKLKFTAPSVEAIFGGKLDGVGLYYPNPIRQIDIENVSFTRTATKAIELVLPSAPGGYEGIEISGCQFGTFAANAEAGIYADGFDSTADLELFKIESNYFTTNTGNTGSSGVQAAIHLVNSCASVLNNTISGTGYKIGILNLGAAMQTNSFFCSNIISNCLDGISNGTGLTTENWRGYSKLNDISGNDIGHLSTDNDDGGIDFCRYHGNNGPGLKVATATSKINISGVHHLLPDTSSDYAGWNTLDSNGLTNSNTGQIEIANHSSVLKFGTFDTVTTNWGHNNLITDTTINHWLFYNSDGSTTYSLKMNSNYFGTGSLASPTSIPWSNGTNTTGNFYQVVSQIICCGGDFRRSTTPFTLNFSVTCGIGFETAHEKGSTPTIQSIMDDSQAECDRLQEKVDLYDQSNLYTQLNDTGRYYIEHCANQSGSFHTFVALDGAVQFMGGDNNRWLEYREWLKKVLYLSLDSLYYCSDANSILNTFQYFRPGQGIDYEGLISVIDYLLQENRCPEAKKYLLSTRSYYRDKQIQAWQDTVEDPTRTPLDTSDVTLESLDLQILKGELAVTSSPVIVPSLEEVFVTKNPFTQETSLETILHEAQMLKLEIYDVLGKKLYDENRFFPDGKMKWTLTGNSLPHGPLYARISTVEGKVRSVKLIHE